ncbi:hypothetical protein PCANC_10848 [Puccinia coronata f. sp. avenae]|uniref:Uncharacterized protein n=1 Tax=Puccinia coronata f. sp. avenae TaxID=200324 RepID=A0A2N5U0J3_9BASI|nr:hypothetical protein PCASD_18498 [Puccinia coronata f. sp. avenae]PLW18702.1 hypothetical protein PCANC_12567 [Puccinia coronata f. sp. avenae]PLW31271.1 hypothetical protein PCASD_15204 [Puccinia coronata f. sp. avenae]PLW43653.1 hypothetical protein PCANC_10848 [Puccinia coronata f. sp. avenae]
MSEPSIELYQLDCQLGHRVFTARSSRPTKLFTDWVTQLCKLNGRLGRQACAGLTAESTFQLPKTCDTILSYLGCRSCTYLMAGSATESFYSPMALSVIG